jgi:hypothetical protein
MANIDYNIFEIEPTGLSGFRALSNEDLQLITTSEITKTFKPNDNFIELSFYTLNNIRLQTIGSYTNYSILSRDTTNNENGNSEVSIDVQQDYLSYGFQGQEVKLLYNFLDYPYSNTTNPQDFYIESISPDRTELRLVSVNLGKTEVLDTTNQLISSFTNVAYSPDFYIYFGNNIFYSIINIDVEEFRDTTAVLVKLYKPLPSTVNPKVRLNIIEKVSDSIAFEINTVITPEKEVIPTLRGANFNVEIEEQATEPSKYFNYTELFSFPTNNTYRELNSLYNEKGAELGIDYSDFNNFINFSSAEERLRNFKYKLDLINSYQSSLDNINVAGVTYNNVGITGSRVYYENLLNGVVNNLDHYERHLYFESGSTAWPKSNSTKPYINQESSNTEATNWYLSEIEDAILYDAQNPDILTNSIPTYLKEDTSNEPYNLFINMIGQHFDNLWIYTDAVSLKYDADNRLNRGASKDLVEELLKNFGIKLYTSNKSVEDLFKYFTVNSYDIGEEQLDFNDGIITSGQQPLSQNDYQKEIYKRIYHNLPLLMKSKGTERGLRALINCFGIPSDTLKIKIFGGQSANDLPFFGGEQAWTGSIDKVRLDNTGSIAPGNTLSFYTSIIDSNKKYTQDLHRIEVGFSPTDNIDSYIVSQSAVLFPNDPFNIDDYIGDPRGYPTNRYTDLYNYAETIFENVDAYDVKDFVRLIKFFDNVIFRMVRDFTPARNVTDAGIIIKPHLLERYKAKEPTLTWTRPEYTGSINIASITGSNGGAYKNIGLKSFDGESSVKYKKVVKTPYGNSPRYVNNFSLDQVEKNFGEAKFDGELRNSGIRISNGELNEDNPYKQIDYPEIRYHVQFWDEIPDNVCILSTQEESFVVNNPTQPVNLAASSMFTGDIPVIYSYTVDGNPPNGANSYTHQFPSTQYGTYNVVATHNLHPNIDNLSTNEQGCQEEREVVVCTCRLNEPQGSYPNTVTVSTAYNLYNWFFDNTQSFTNDPTQTGIINTQITFLVEGIEVGRTEDGTTNNTSTSFTAQTDPTNYVFNNIPEGTQFVTVVAQDSNDSNCKIELTLPFDSCTLYDETVDTPRPTGGFILDQGVLLLDNQNPTSYYTYQYPFNFGGVTDTTTYEFRVRITHRYRNPDSSVTTTTYGPTDWIDIVDPEGGSSPGLASTIPSNYADLIEQFPDAEPAGVPEVSSGVYAEGTFTREIQFRATSSQDCQLTGVFYIMAAARLEKRAVTMYYRNVIYSQSFGSSFCSTTQTRDVYVLVPETSAPIDASTVISQKLRIYEYPDDLDTTPAPQGTYGFEMAGGEVLAGRIWNYNDYSAINGYWDTSSNYYNTTSNLPWSVNNGFLICGEAGDIGDIGDSDGGDNRITIGFNR